MPSRSQRFSKRSRTSSGAAGERDDDVFDPLVSDNPLEVPAGPEDREAGDVASVKRLLVEEPDRSQPHLGMLGEPFRN